jgi:hypothetical protein
MLADIARQLEVLPDLSARDAAISALGRLHLRPLSALPLAAWDNVMAAGGAVLAAAMPLEACWRRIKRSPIDSEERDFVRRLKASPTDPMSAMAEAATPRSASVATRNSRSAGATSKPKHRCRRSLRR